MAYNRWADVGKYALVIGAQTFGLEGVVHDARRVADALTRLEFSIDLRLAPFATRQGILDGFDALIAKVEPDDAVVVYYAGHCVVAYNLDPADRLQTVQAIVPFDHELESRESRMITAWELEIKLAQLTAKTRNVTVFLDCCHAGQMKLDSAVPCDDPHPMRISFRDYLAVLKTLYGDVETAPLGNPEVVRFVASGPMESAWEYKRADGTRAGVFTEQLLDVLASVGDTSISCSAIADAVRERVLAHGEGLGRHQRPNVEGPAQRQLFSLRHADPTRTVTMAASGTQLRIHTGEILGTSMGDTYAAMPFGSTSFDEDRAIATLRVLRAAPFVAIVEPAWKNGHTHLPEDAVAVPVERTALRHPVALIAPDTERDAVATALAATRTLRIADPGEGVAPIATLRLAGHQLTIEDPAGPIFPPARYPQDLADTVRNLASLGAVRWIHSLAGEHGMSSRDLDISWGVVCEGRRMQMPDHGASLDLGDRIYVEVHHTGLESRYVHVFHVGARRKVTLLTGNVAPSGHLVRADMPRLVLGEHQGKLLGFQPERGDRFTGGASPGTDSLFVFVTTQPVSLHSLETERVVMARNMCDAEPVEGFLVKRLSYRFHPREAAITDFAFKIDESVGR